MPHCERNVEGCPAGQSRGRHRHRCRDLNDIGEACPCGATEWWVAFGGLLPALIYCHACSAGFNLTERLRAISNIKMRKHGVR